MSAVVSSILKHSFCGATDPTFAGILLDLPDGTTMRLFIKFSMFIGDELAIQEVNCTRGANAEKPCFKCLNMKNKNSLDLADDGSGYFVPHTELDMTKLKLHTDRSIFLTFQKLSTRVHIESKEDFDDTQKIHGFTFHPGSILLEPKLSEIYKPIACTVFDWMHCLLVNAVFGLVFGGLMLRCKPFNITYEVLHEYLQHWHWPARVSSRGVTGKDSCDAKHAGKWYTEGEFKVQASESLSLYPVFAYYFMNTVGVDIMLKDEIRCLLLLADLLDTFLLIARKHVSATPARLKEKVLRFLNKYRDTYGTVDFTWKFHSLLHFPEFLERHGILFPCFVHERKHKLIKRYARDISNTSGNFERSVLAEVTDHQLSVMANSEFSCKAKLLSISKRPSQELVASIRVYFELRADTPVVIGTHARFSEWGIAHRGDVVISRNGQDKSVGRIYWIAEVAGEIAFGIEEWSYIAETRGGSKWRSSNPGSNIILADDIVDTLIWSCDHAAGIATVITPPWLYSI